MQVRLSYLMPVAMAAVMFRLESVSLGLLAGVILLLSVLVHELAHWFAARAGGASVTDLTLWPLGGLTDCTEQTPFSARIKALFAGPAVSLLIAAGCLFQLSRLGIPPNQMNPLNGFVLLASESTFVLTLQMLCFTNLMLVGANLIPVIPFDAGLMLRTLLCERYAELEARDLVVRLGLALSTTALIAGFVFDQSSIVALAGFVLILHLHETVTRSDRDPKYNPSDSRDDSGEFMEADCEFDELEAAEEHGTESDTDELIAHAAMMARWTARREAERLRRETSERQREEKQVDAILERIHRDGRKSLKPPELKLLCKVSSLYRKRAKTRQQNDDVKS